jgi:hypothetical protein
MKFSRKIKLTDPIIPYFADEKTSEEDIKKFSENTFYAAINNCHWGALKLFYSEVEFLTLASKYIDINKSLILYVGAQPGFRLKYLFIKAFFPKINMLLYDPRPFDIEESEQIIIKTGSDGWFSDEKINEVLKIADGRQILYISDIRLNDDDAYVRESMIHDDMQQQQRWGIKMSAEFMLLKFRMFFYSKNPKEVNFINNKLPEQYADQIIYTKNTEKHNDIHNWMLYLKGSIYTQLYAKPRSTESRLFVKKIKYHKDSDKYSKEDQEKYKMKYYDNMLYEGLFNYFNLKKRNAEIVYGKSDKLIKYLPGQKVSYTSASEYYIIKKYLQFTKRSQPSEKIKVSFKAILNKIIEVYTFLNNRYNNNLIICGQFKALKGIKRKENSGERYTTVKKYVEDNVDKFIKYCNKQFKTLRKSKFVDEETKDKFIKSFKTDKNMFFDINNGIIKRKQAR